MLAWRADAGCSGLIEPEQAQMIMELIMTEGFLGLTDKFPVQIDVHLKAVFFLDFHANLDSLALKVFVQSGHRGNAKGRRHEDPR